jgi:hypothetical protein
MPSPVPGLGATSTFSVHASRHGSQSGQPAAVRPAFVRNPSVPANESRLGLAKDKGVPTEQARIFQNMGSMGPYVADWWRSLPAGDFELPTPSVSEMPGGPNQNRMYARPLPNGVVIRPNMNAQDVAAPVLTVQAAADHPSGVVFDLNGKVLTAQSSPEDIRLAFELMKALHFPS